MTIRVLVCVRNAEPFIRKCLASIYAQDHNDFTVTVVDDVSTDGTREIVADTVKLGWTAVLNDERVGATGNIWNNTRDLADDDILVLVDGDDALACTDALSHIAGVYETDPDCWLTYGSYEPSPPDPTCPAVEDYPLHVIRERSFRTWSNVFNHPLSFAGHLFNHIREEDLRLANGEWVPGVYDEALLYSATELAGPNIRRLERVLYIYNSANGQSCVHTQADAIYAAGLELRARPKRDRLYRDNEGKLIEWSDIRSDSMADIMGDAGLNWCIDLGTRSIDYWFLTYPSPEFRAVTFHADGPDYYAAALSDIPRRIPIFGDVIEAFPWVTDSIPSALWWVDGDDPRVMDLLFQVIGRGKGDVIAVDDAWLAPVDEIRGQVAQLSEAFGRAYRVDVQYDIVRVTPGGNE